MACSEFFTVLAEHLPCPRMFHQLEFVLLGLAAMDWLMSEEGVVVGTRMAYFLLLLAQITLFLPEVLGQPQVLVH
jgi:hypothetical protein